METIRAKIGSLLQQHLDELLEAVLAAYERSIPRIAACTPEERALVIGGTSAALRSFARLLADREVPVAPLLSYARTATIGRAGDVFTRDEILEMMRIARQVVVHTMRQIAGHELEMTDTQRAQLDATMDGFLSEIGRAENEILPETAVDLLLARAEGEEADLA